jgi:hypothetical protein
MVGCCITDLKGDIGFTHARVVVTNVSQLPKPTVRNKPDNNVLMVTYADIGRDDLDSWLASSSPNFTAFLVSTRANSVGQLMASSSGIDADTFAAVGTVAVGAITSGDDTVKATAQFIDNSIGFNAFTTETELIQPLGAALSSGVWLGNWTVNWVAVVCLPFEEYVGVFSDQLLVPLLVAFGALVATFYCVWHVVLPPRVEVRERALSPLQTMAELNEHDSHGVSAAALALLRSECLPHVEAAYAHHWRRMQRSHAVRLLSSDELYRTQLEFAVQLVQDSFAGVAL